MKNLAIALIALSFLIACTKSASNNSPALTKETLAGNYKITAATADIGGTQTDVLNAYLSECKRDDIYTLNADGTYKVTDAGVTCSPASDTTGTWSLSGKDITIGSMELTVTDFTGSQIKGQSQYSYDTGGINVNATVNVVLTKQ